MGLSGYGGGTVAASPAVVRPPAIRATTTLLWTLDEPTGPWANTGSAGTLNMTTGGTPKSRTGIYGKCQRFGAHLLTTGDTSVGQTAGDFTMTALVYPRAAGGYTKIFTKGYNTGANYAAPYTSAGFMLNGGTNSVAFQITKGSTNYTVGTPSGADGLDLNQWNFLAGTYNSTSNVLTIFKNGDSIATMTAAAGAVNWGANGPWLIGANQGLAEFFDGDIDHVAMDTGLLSAATLTTLYNNAVNRP